MTGREFMLEAMELCIFMGICIFTLIAALCWVFLLLGAVQRVWPMLGA